MKLLCYFGLHKVNVVVDPPKQDAGGFTFAIKVVCPHCPKVHQKVNFGFHFTNVGGDVIVDGEEWKKGIPPGGKWEDLDVP